MVNKMKAVRKMKNKNGKWQKTRANKLEKLQEKLIEN